MWRALTAAMVAVYPSDGFTNAAAWPRCAPLTPHLLWVCAEMGFGTANAQCAILLDRACSYFHGRGAYLRARPLGERALTIRENVLGLEHPDTTMSLNNLARLLHDQGEYRVQMV
jgi:hypothetical protein